MWEIGQLKGYLKWEAEIQTHLEEMAGNIPYVENIQEIRGLGIRTIK